MASPKTIPFGAPPIAPVSQPKTIPFGTAPLAPVASAPNTAIAAEKEKGSLLTPLREGVQGLRTLYGGGEQGIARKLQSNITESAKDIQEGNVVKGVAKAAGRTAGDVAGLIYAPIAAAVGATGIGKVFEKAQKGMEDQAGNGSVLDKLTDIPAVQEFAMKHPNAAEDFGRFLNIVFAGQEKGKIEPKTSLTRTSEQLQAFDTKLGEIRPTEESVTASRRAKLNEGFEEQNTRLKTVDAAFNKNTIIRKTPEGKTETITPIDTFAKHNITPVIEKGTIKMGDYRTGTGELGRIKQTVSALDDQIDTTLKNTGQRIATKELEQAAIDRAMANEDFRRAGKVQSEVAKITSRFDDYKKSYGDEIDIAEINNIRKVANKDFDELTQDTSRIVGDVARDVVYNATDDEIIKGLLREQGELLAARNYAEKINGTKVTGGRLGTMALRQTGAIIGTTLDKFPVVGPMAGMLGGDLASRALQQAQFKSAWAELQGLLVKSKK